LRRAFVPTVFALALVVSGCGAVGRVTTGDASHGKQLFTASATPSAPSCASCHTLADAKSQGTVGPNLDDAFSSDKSQGFSEQTLRDVVRGQIAYPEAPMPANLFRGQDAKDVATYVAKCAGNPACGVTAARSAPASTTPATTTTATTTTATTTTTTGPSGGGTAAGKQVFASAGCGGCHTLKDAGASGNVGPNLDALKPSEARVEKQVTNGGAAMPAFKGRLTAAQIKAVATYVATVAGK
jgi:mono/diheme cytochrome c family protein